MCEQKIIHKYKRYSDLTPINGFDVMTSSVDYRERFSVQREMYGKGIKAAKRKKQLSKTDWNPKKKRAVTIQLHIPRYSYNGGPIQQEEFVCFEGDYSEELLTIMLDYYLDDDISIASYNEKFFMKGKSPQQILELIKNIALKTKKWVDCKTDAKTIALLQLSYKTNFLTLLIDYEAEKIFDILCDATDEKIIETIKNKAQFTEYIYSNFSTKFIKMLRKHLPTVQYIVDYMQIPLFIDDLITQKSSTECRQKLRECHQNFEDIFNKYTSYNIAQEKIFKQLAELKDIATSFAYLDISKQIITFLEAFNNSYSTYYKEHEGFSKLYVPYKHIKNVIKIILRGCNDNTGKKMTIERLYFHMYCQFERLIGKSVKLEDDLKKIEEIEDGKYGTFDTKISPTRINSELYQMMWTGVERLIYQPAYMCIDDNTNSKYVGKHGVNIWYFIGIVLGDIGYSVNPQQFHKYEIAHLCETGVYSDLEALNSNQVTITGVSVLEHNSYPHSLEVFLEQKQPSGRWKNIDSWSESSEAGIDILITKHKNVETNYYYRVKSLHHIGDETVITYSEEVWVGMNREEFQTLKESGYFDDK